MIKLWHFAAVSAVVVPTLIVSHLIPAETTVETVSFAPLTSEAEEIIVETLEAVKTGNFEVAAASETETALSYEESLAARFDTEFFRDEWETEEVVETVETVDNSPLYKCHGVMLDEAYQEYAYRMLKDLGMSDFFPVWICECFQESSFQTDQRTLNHGHYDCGLMQIRETYWEEFQQESGISGGIMDPYTNIAVSVWLLHEYYEAYDGCIEETVSHYMSGWHGEYMESYVDAVLGHLEFLERVR